MKKHFLIPLITFIVVVSGVSGKSTTEANNYILEGFRIRFDHIKPEQVTLKIEYNYRSIWEKSVMSDDVNSDIAFSADTNFSEEPKKGYSGDDSIYLYISAEGYAPQWHRLIHEGNSLELEDRVTLHQKKYAIIEYEYYAGDERDMSQREPTHKGIAAVGHWGSIPGFGSDWQVWQGDEDDLWGDHLYLEHHRGNQENGIVDTNTPFDRMEEAPKDGYIHHGVCGVSSIEMRKGDRFYSRVTGHTQSTRGYGKIWIKDIVDQLPPEIEVFEQ